MTAIRTSASQLKAKLGQYMKAVRAGKVVVVTDREQPIARISPYQERRPGPGGEIRASQPRLPSAPPLGQVQVRPIRYRGKDTTALLAEDRKQR